MADITGMLQAAAGNAGEDVDPFFQDTVLLLHGDGTNGAQNNTFLDSSTNNFTITRNGNTTQGTFSPFSKPDGRWGNYFDGTGDDVSFPIDSDFTLGSNEFTIEGWVYPNTVTSSNALFSLESSSYPAVLILCGAGTISFLVSSTRSSFQVNLTGFTLLTNTWSHIVLQRNGDVFRAFINGVVVGSETQAITLQSQRSVGYIGRDDGGSVRWNGYVSNFRVVNGTAVYSTSGFTPPTAPLTNITNTSLLTCQSNRFKDNSTNNFTITPNGDVKVTPFSPFPLTTEYSPSVNGGSGYFDGSGDYLSGSSWSSAGVFSTGDFNISFWIYATGAPQANQVIWSCANVPSSGLYMGYSGGGSTNLTVVAWPTTLITASGGWSFNEWHWITLERSSGTLTLYIDGVSRGSVANTTDFSEGLQYIGRPNDTANYMTQGYISDFRIVKSTATYAIPTAPLTDIANTSLLCNFTNAGILDNTGFNALETVGNAQIDTTTKKYGTGSIEFDGTGDYLLLPSGQNVVFGTGDFTVECWVNFTGLANYRAIIDTRASVNSATGWILGVDVNGAIYIYSNGFLLQSSNGAISTSTFHHIAYVRASGTHALYVDGTSVDTDATARTYSDTLCAIGGASWSLGTELMYGYIDDLRITKGVARYLTTFTPPTKAFPDLGE